MANVLEVVITAKDEASGVLKGVGGVLSGALKVGLGVAVAGFGLLATGIGVAVHEAMDAQQVQSQLASVLQSTGGVAGVTADMANDLANSLQGVTRFSDEAVLGGENMLLTFTNIGKDIFPQATETILDMSTALGQDLKASAIQLGKALQDPVQGVTALRRVGVNFTEDQQKMIKAMVDAGKVEEAQKFILKELQTEFGGSARAAGQTFAGQLDILKNTVGNVAEGVGMSLIPILQNFMSNVVMPLVPLLQTVGEAFSDLIQTGDLGVFLDDIKEGFQGLVPPDVIDAIANVVLWVRDTLLPALQSMGEWLVTVGIPTFLDWVTTIWSQLGPGLAQLAVWIQDIAAVILPLLQQAIAFVVQHWQIFAAIAAVVGAVILALNAPIAAIIAAVVLLATAWANNWGGIRDIVANVWNQYLGPIFTILKGWLDVNLPIAIQFLKDAWETVLLPAIRLVWTFIQEQVFPLISKLIDLYLKALISNLQSTANYWNDVLLPAIRNVWNWVSTVLIPFIRDQLIPWISQRTTEAIQTLSNFWNNTLLPAITSAWKFFNEKILPIIKDVIDIMEKLGSITITALAGFWQNVLQPALKVAYDFFNDNILPVLKDVRDFISDEIGPKLLWFKNSVIDPLANAISKGLSGAIDWVRTQLDNLKNLIDTIKLPPWLTPGSPTPFEEGLRGIARALSDINAMQLPQFSTSVMGMGAQQVVTRGGNTTQNTFYLNANYPYQSPRDLAADVSMLEQLYG